MKLSCEIQDNENNILNLLHIMYWNFLQNHLLLLFLLNLLHIMYWNANEILPDEINVLIEPITYNVLKPGITKDGPIKIYLNLLHIMYWNVVNLHLTLLGFYLNLLHIMYWNPLYETLTFGESGTWTYYI